MPHYGFNFLWMYVKSEKCPEPAEPNLKELDFIAEHGFNFVRIPVDYHFWTEGFDYFHPNERIIEYFDRYIEACRSRGLHVSVNIHRAPGYCINWPERERHNLWKDSEAQEGFYFMWQNFARRYKGISSKDLSFDLVNEPASVEPTHPCTRADHEKVIRTAVAAIREIDPERQIVIDGFDGGGSALPELADLGSQNVIHSGRGYEPFSVTHYKAEWVRGNKSDYIPAYERSDESRERLMKYYQPWREVAARGVPIHIGEFGCYNKIDNRIALLWFADILSVYKELGWGWSLWNFKGAFGVCEHGRPNTNWKNIGGFNIDADLFELLKKSRD
jgi:endoglucanase